MPNCFGAKELLLEHGQQYNKMEEKLVQLETSMDERMMTMMALLEKSLEQRSYSS